MTRQEIVEMCACKCGCGRRHIVGGVVSKLVAASYYLGSTFSILSGVRCVKHNEAVGGSPGSFHLAGLAVDVSVSDSKVAWQYFESQMWGGLGYNPVGRSFHLDMGGRFARWHKINNKYCYIV